MDHFVFKKGRTESKTLFTFDRIYEASHLCEYADVYEKLVQALGKWDDRWKTRATSGISDEQILGQWGRSPEKSGVRRAGSATRRIRERKGDKVD